MAKKLTKSKASEILKDGTAHKKKLTKKQVKFFQAVKHGMIPNKAGGGYIDTLFQQYPGLSSFSKHSDYMVDTSNQEMINILRKHNSGIEFQNKGETNYSWGNDSMKLDNPNKYRIYIDPQHPQNRNDAIKLDILSHAFHNNPAYQSFSNDLQDKLYKKYGEKMIERNDGVDGYIRGYLSNSPEYQSYKKELSFLPKDYFKPLDNILKGTNQPINPRMFPGQSYETKEFQFGGNVVSKKSENMKLSKKELKKEKELKKFGGLTFPNKAQDGQQINIQGQGYNWNYTNPAINGYGNSYGYDNTYYGQGLPTPNFNVPQGFNFGQPMSYPDMQVSPNTNPNTVTNLGSYYGAKNNQVIVPEGNMYSTSKQSKISPWEAANYTTPLGHSGNYWGDFAFATGRQIGALSHAIPDTLGTIKQNKFNTNYENNLIKQQSQQYISPGANSYGSNRGMTMAYGGVNNYKADGGNGIFPNVNVEGGGGNKEGEVLQLPDGLIGAVNGERHSSGGIDMNLPLSTKVFSEKLKHPDEKKSFAKLAKKYDTEKEMEMLNNPKADKVQKESAQLAIDLKNRKANELFQEQEKMKLGGTFGKAIAKKTAKDYKEMNSQHMSNMYEAGGYWNHGVMPLLYSPMAGGGTVPMNTLPVDRARVNNIPTPTPINSPFNWQYGDQITETLVPQKHRLYDRIERFLSPKQYKETLTNNLYSYPVDTINKPLIDKMEGYNSGGLIGTNNQYFAKHQIPYLYSPQMYGGFLGNHNSAVRVMPLIEAHSSAYGGNVYGNGGLANKVMPILADGGKPISTAQYNSLDDAYEDYKQTGYTGKKDIGQIQDWLVANHPQELDNYLQMVPLTNKGAELYGEDYRQNPTYLTKEQRLKQFQDEKYDYRLPILGNFKQPLGRLQPTTSQTASQTTSTTPDVTASGAYSPAKGGGKGFNYQVLPVPVPSVYDKIPINYRAVTPNLIPYRPGDNLGELNEINRATRGLSRFLPTTAEGIGAAANLQGTALERQAQSFGNLYNRNQQLRTSIDEANQRELSRVGEFNVNAFLNQDKYRMERDYNRLTQARTDANQGLENLYKAQQFATTADFLGRTINPLNYYGITGGDLFKGTSISPEDQRVLRERINQNQYGYVGGKLERTGTISKTEAPEQKFGGKVKIKKKKKV